MSARYITTTLPYVNSDPHIGFALEAIQADVCARTWRTVGDTVFFSTGTDEHGQKLLEAAVREGEEVQTYVDRYAAEFQKLPKALGLSNDSFVRTTDSCHIEAAQEMWRRCKAKGDIYKKSYEGLYCVGHEAFITDKDLVEGKCPEHGTEPQFLKEENYFFRLSKYQDYLLEYLKQPETIVPEWRRAEAIAFVEQGLEDFSISREKARLAWGVAVPEDDTQVMYVWFDALTNYISTLGWPSDSQGNFKKFWEDGATLQVAGKDQVRFQSLMWQAMLASAELKSTNSVFYHGFITSEGQKMSKTIGNVINPLELVDVYGTDALRYVLLRHVSPFEDSDLTREAIRDHYNAHLTNGLGNLVARVMKLAEDHLSGPVRVPEESMALHPTFLKAIERFQFNEAMEYVFHIASASDAFMAEHTPYKGVKSENQAKKEKAYKDITFLVQELARIATHLVPVMPETARAIAEAVAQNKKPENLFPRL